MTKPILLLAATALLAGSATAQSPEKLLLVGASANAFKGELNAHYNRFTPAVHASLQLNRKKRLNGSFNLQIGSVQMQTTKSQIALPDSSTANPTRFVKTSFIGLHYALQFNFVKTEHWMVYLSQGIGLLRYTPKDANGNKLESNTTTRGQGETFGTISLMLPTSLGAMYLFSNGYGLGAQAGFLNQTSNYLDNMEDLAAKKRGDNILQYRFTFAIPLGYSQNTGTEAPTGTNP